MADTKKPASGKDGGSTGSKGSGMKESSKKEAQSGSTGGQKGGGGRGNASGSKA